jgi:hypothetical protein
LELFGFQYTESLLIYGNNKEQFNRKQSAGMFVSCFVYQKLLDSEQSHHNWQEVQALSRNTGKQRRKN